MDELIQDLLQASARLYSHLTTVPPAEERDEYIVIIEALLDERGEIIDELMESGFVVDAQNNVHGILADLDKGIKERLNKVLGAVKEDMRELNKQKKNEIQYMNPYSHLQVMDGMYYDKKK
jgi:flagellar protein FliT